jgi:hypothetical protein
MSQALPNYCGPHGVRYAGPHCRECVLDWLNALPPVERALADYRADRSVRTVKKLIEDFRKLEAA